MALFAWISKVFDWFTWLAKPAVSPLLGAVVAFVAAIASEPRQLLPSPEKAAWRACRVALIWLVIASLLGAALHYGSGEDGGRGGVKAAREGTRHEGSISEVPLVRPSDGSSERFDLVVRFVPSAVDRGKALEFSCDLECASIRKAYAIRASSMQEFDTDVRRVLRVHIAPRLPEHSRVLIRREPFPGESVLRRIHETVQAELPSAHVELR